MNDIQAYFNQLSLAQKQRYVVETLRRLGNIFKPGGGEILVKELKALSADCLVTKDDEVPLTLEEQSIYDEMLISMRKQTPSITALLEAAYGPRGLTIFAIRLQDEVRKLMK